jgi:hypothetical protein
MWPKRVAVKARGVAGAGCGSGSDYDRLRHGIQGWELVTVLLASLAVLADRRDPR